MMIRQGGKTCITLLLLLLLTITACNRCVNLHCPTSFQKCRDDKAEDLPCHTVVNACLDLCPSATDYACISFCIAKSHNVFASKFVSCCSEFSCKIEKYGPGKTKVFTSSERVNLNLILPQD